MTWLLYLQNAFGYSAQNAVERALNSIPEGLLIVLFAWMMLRIAGRQNAGTRFAVWIIALIAIAGLPFFTAFDSAFSTAHSYLHPQITLPAFWIVPLCALWAIGVAIAMARLVAGLWQVRAIRRASTAMDIATQERAQEILERHGVSGPLRLAESDRVRVPAAIGFWKPMIVLPSGVFRDFSTDALSTVLIHELAHIQRRDNWTNLFQKIVRAVFFFHPAVWWIDAKLSLEREMACDDTVLKKTGNPRAYASCLIEMLEKNCTRRGWTMAQSVVHRAHEASLRIAQILDSRRPVTTRVWKIAPAIAGIFLLACISPRLVVFLPGRQPVATQRMDASMSRPSGAVAIPASLYVGRPAAYTETAKYAPSHDRRPVKQTVMRPAHSRVSPKAILTKADLREDLRAQMLVFVQTMEIEHDATETIPGTDKPVLRIQLLRLVLITPAQANGVSGNSI